MSHRRKKAAFAVPSIGPVSPSSGRREAQLHPTRLAAEIKPFSLCYLATVGSTNTYAATMRRQGKLFAPSIILTSRQTAGRGRGSNRWHAPRGVLTATLVVPAHESIPPHQIPLVAGVAVREAVAQLGATGVGLKWPNDLWHDDMKLAGLLCERVDGVDLIGVGINVCVDPASLSPVLANQFTSLDRILGKSISMDQTMIAIAAQIAGHLLQDKLPVRSMLQQFSRHDVLIGRRIRVSDGTSVIEGTGAGIDAVGRLIVMTGGVGRAVLSGNVSLATN